MAENEQGFNPQRYQVIPRSLIFIFREDKVLLLKGRPDKKIWSGMYNGLGGHIESGEDVLAGAQRELLEESGIADSHLELCGLITINLKGNTGIMLFVFKGDYEGGKLIESEEGSLEWVDVNAIKDLPVVEDLKTILPLVAKYQPGGQPFFGRYYYGDDEKLRIEINSE
jgi:8-oxo-dGTP diphosphatase